MMGSRRRTVSSISSFIASYASSNFNLSRQLVTDSNAAQPTVRTDLPRVVDDGGSRQERDREQVQRPNRLSGPRPSLGAGLGLGSFRSLMPGMQQRQPAGQGLAPQVPPRRPNPPAVAPDGNSEAQGGSLDDRLKDLDPKLAQQLKSLRELLASVDPEAAKTLDSIVEKLFGHMDELGGQGNTTTGNGGTRTPSVGLSYEHIEIAIESTVTDLQIQAADGTTITAHVVHQTFKANIEKLVVQSDPLILDLNDNGIFDTTSADNGALFDLNGDGKPDQAANVANGDGFLALDLNDNGQIDDGRELFGDQNGAANGFEELRRYDGNRDGKIDVRDSIFPKLKVYNDINQNGQTDIGELKSLQEFQIAALLIDSQLINEQTDGGQAVLGSSFQRTDGSTSRIGDLLMNYFA